MIAIIFDVTPILCNISIAMAVFNELAKYEGITSYFTNQFIVLLDVNRDIRPVLIG